MDNSTYDFIVECFRTEYLIAEGWKDPEAHRVILRLAHTMVDMAQEGNPSFNRDRFLQDCRI